MAEKQILINREEIESRKGYHFAKRFLDIVLSAIGLIVFSPLMVVIAYKIKKEDGGPILYKQVRIGKNGHSFKMYKFRSMVINADKLLEKLKNQNEVNGAMFKMKHDPRITAVGYFIRRHSLDELPQLVNVLKGNMSLLVPGHHYLQRLSSILIMINSDCMLYQVVPAYGRQLRGIMLALMIWLN